MVTERIPEPVPYRIYTPPDWNRTHRLPLVVYLHHRNGHCTDLETGKVVQFMFDLVREGALKPFILAAPESDGYWWDYHDGSHRYTEFLMEDFIPGLRKKYSIKKGRAGIHIIGVGTGAQAAVEISYRYPGKMATVGALGAYFFDEYAAARYVETNLFSGLNKILGPPGDRLAMADHSVFTQIASRDSVGPVRYILGAGSFSDWDTTESNELFRQHLSLLNIPHDYVVYHGTAKWQSRRNIIPVFIGLQLGDRRNRGEINGMPYEVLKFR